MNSPLSPFQYPLDQCDVVDKAKLKQYREKAARWHEWLETDPEHSIATQLSDILWQDAVFRCLNECRKPPAGESSSARASLLAMFIDRGYVASQVLGISKLVDARRDVVSVRRLLSEISDSRGLITREVYVGHDGLPYDWQETLHASGSLSGGIHWLDVSGPKAWGTSERLHVAFDELSGTTETTRTRDDLIGPEVFSRLEQALNAQVFEHIRELRHKRLAHAADSLSRGGARSAVQMQVVAEAHRILLQVTQVIQSTILFGSWRGGSIPVPQFDLFDKLDRPYAVEGKITELEVLWSDLTEERDRWLSEARQIIQP